MEKLEKTIAHVAGILLFIFFISIVYAAFVLDIRVPTCIVDKPLFKEAKVIPQGDDHFEVHYVARMWNFEPTEIEIPVGSTVDMYVTSLDVTHGFHVHNTNTNIMAVPGTVNYSKIKFNEIGEYPIVCHEYCGSGHQNMKATIKVVAQAPKKIVQVVEAPKSPGFLLSQTKGCFACHSIDGKPAIGPTFKGLLNRDEKLTSGASVKATRAYIKESILDPQKKIVAGFQPVMPVIPMTPDELELLIQYIEELK